MQLIRRITLLVALALTEGGDGAKKRHAAHTPNTTSYTSNVTFQSCRAALNAQILARSFRHDGDPAPRVSTRPVCRGLPTASPPRVAHCLAGSARTLWHVVAHARLQRNLIEAFGGAHNTFAFLKLEDSRGDGWLKKESYNVHPLNAQLAQLAGALATLDPTTLVVAPNVPAVAYSVPFPRRAAFEF